MLKQYLILGLLGFSLCTYLWVCQAKKTQDIISNPEQVAVIFDMDGVLTKTAGMGREFPLGDMLLYMIRERVSHKEIQNRLMSRLFEVMYHLGLQTPTNGLVATSRGYELPNIFCEWQRGHITSAALRTMVVNHIEELNKEEWFHSKREYIVIKKMAEIIFDSATLAKHTKPIKQGWELVKRCKELGYKVCVLSNYDPDTFTLIKKRYQKLFDTYVDEIVVSGYVGTLKPEPAMYYHLLKILRDKYGINAENCWFIDDTPNNIIAAQSININSILCENEHFEPVKLQLQQELPSFTMA